MEAFIENLLTNAKARENLVAALQEIGRTETYTNENVERRAHVRSIVRDIEAGFSGGNDTLLEKGMVWQNGCYRVPRKPAEA